MEHDDNGIDRRHALECMLWAGTGVLWTVTGGVPASTLLGSAQAADTGFSFLQLSDSHVGFDKAGQSECARHPGRSRQQGHRDAGQAVLHDSHRRHHASVEAEGIRRCRAGARAVSSSTRITCRANTTSSMRMPARPISIVTARARKAHGWYSFDQAGVHFIGLVNVVNLKAGGMGNLGPDQLAWLADDLQGQEPHRRRSSCSRISRCGPLRPNGAGARRIPRRRWNC